VRNNTDLLFNNPDGNTPTLITTNVNFSNQSLQYQIQSERTSINAMLLAWQSELAGVSTASDLATLANYAQNNLQSVSAYLSDLNSLFTIYASGNTGMQGMAQANILSAQGSITGQTAALTGVIQAVSSAQAGVTQAQAGLTLKTSQARPEDIAAAQAQVASAQGAVQIAEAAYNNRIITAPGDGVVTAVYVSVGQIATPNTPAIDLAGQTVSKNVAIMIPNNAIIDNAGTLYVLVKSGDSTVQKIITTGASDATNTEILSGLQAGDEVVTH
jgi:multidrug efflux pump subunit AcrA (membrane-fusion protein)